MTLDLPLVLVWTQMVRGSGLGSQTVHSQQTLEGLLKLQVRARVDDGIDATVEIA